MDRKEGSVMFDRRRFMMFSGYIPSDLPEGYTHVEYVETTYNCWIELNVAGNSIYGIDFTNWPSYDMYGAGNSLRAYLGVNNNNCLSTYTATGSGLQYYKNGTRIGNLSYNIWKKQTRFYTDNGIIYPFNVEYETPLFSDSGNIRIGRGNAQNGWESKCPQRVYSCTFYNEFGEIFFNVIPCRDKNGDGYLYDKISKTLIGATGSGELISGPDIPIYIIPSDCTLVEYVDTSTSNYIELGFKCNELYAAKLSTSFIGTNANASGVVMGSINGRNCFYYRTTSSASLGYIKNNTTIISGARNITTKVTWLFEDGYLISPYLSSTPTTPIFDTEDTVVMCRCTTNGWMSYLPQRIYDIKLYGQNNNLIFDAIPVKKEDKGYLWDNVSRTLIGASGTGDLNCGPVVT